MKEEIMKGGAVVVKFRFPRALYEEIRELAHKEHRKINEQVAYFCDKALEEERKDKLEG